MLIGTDGIRYELAGLIRQLEDAHVLVDFSGRKRRRLWQAPQVITALNDFAARAGRRQAPRR